MCLCVQRAFEKDVVFYGQPIALSAFNWWNWWNWADKMHVWHKTYSSSYLWFVRPFDSKPYAPFVFFVSSVLLRLIKSFDSFQGCHTRNGVVFICSAWIVLRLKEWFVYKINKWLNARTVPLQMSQSNRIQRKKAVELIDIVRRIINFMKVHIWNIRHFTKIKINAAERWICSSVPFHFVCFVYFPLNLIVRVVLMHICNYVNFHFLSVYDHQMWKYSLVKCTVKIMLCIWWNYIKYWCWFGRAANGFGQNVSRSYQFTFNSWNKRENLLGFVSKVGCLPLPTRRRIQ